MEQEDIFFELALAAKKSVEKVQNWTKAILKIKRFEGNVGFESFYALNVEDEIPIDTQVSYKTAMAVNELHKNMATLFGNNSKWNRLIFILFPDNKIKVEYIWEEQLQNEVDRLNSK